MLNIIDRYSRVLSGITETMVSNKKNGLVIIKSIDNNNVEYKDLTTNTIETTPNTYINNSARFSSESCKIDLSYNIQNTDYKEESDIYDKIINKANCNYDTMINTLYQYFSSKKEKLDFSLLKYVMFQHNTMILTTRVTNGYYYSKDDTIDVLFTVIGDKLQITLKINNYEVSKIEINSIEDVIVHLEKENTLREQFKENYYVGLYNDIVTLVPKLDMSNYVEIYNEFMVYLTARKDDIDCVGVIKERLSDNNANGISFYRVITRKFKYYDLMQFVMSIMKSYEQLKANTAKNDYIKINALISYLEETYPDYIKFTKLKYNYDDQSYTIIENGNFSFTDFDKEFTHMSNNRKWRKAYPKFDTFKNSFIDGLYENFKDKVEEDTDSNEETYEDMELDFG